NSSVVRSQSGTGQPRTTQWVRLDTAFTHDFPSRIERLTIGDTITNAGTWGSAVRMGGISWGKDFSLRPDLITTPLLSATGTAVVPSTVDVFVNNQKVTSQQLPPGPFIIDRLPAITGSGQISMVVRDALGREQVLTQSFYSSLNLLAAGLSQYQINVGRIRSNYAISSNDYGDWVAEGTYRYGVNSSLTIEGHAEALQHFGQAAGLNVAVAVGRYGVINAVGAFSSREGKSGSLFGAGIESNLSRVNFTLSSKVASRDYRQVSNAGNGYLQFKQRDLAQVGVSMNRAGSLAAAYVRDSYYDLPAQRNISLSYNALIRSNISVSLVASRLMSDHTSNSYFLTFTMPMGHRRAASLSANGGDGVGAPPNEVYASLIQNAPAGNGYGYHLSASNRSNYNADGRLQTSAGDLDAQVARQQGISGQSLYWSGAFTLLGGDLSATRSVYDSFAMVDVDGIANVPVYVDHQLVTHTDKKGRALLHYLLPYQANRINIEPTELPLDTQIDNQTLTVVPGYRNGVIAKFPVVHVRGATFRLVDESGNAIPVGAQVNFNGKVFPVTYDGMTYVTGYDHGMRARVSWQGGSCDFRVEPPDTQDPLPDLGDVKCRPIKTKFSVAP
ncbi:MAG TPA: fimbria/pilus outer membrane usher protein, partial [Steroidobacteraceae bacterium]|nr:fimbria/pilus outer membrane usher protein [Steroidobacteraceae bacterium]